MIFMHRGIQYPDRSSLMKAVWAEKTKDQRLALTQRGREASLKIVATSEGKIASSERTREQLLRQWSVPEYKAKMEKDRKLQAQVPEERQRKSEAAKKQWTGESGESMAAERKQRWSSPDYKKKMQASGFDRTGSIPWNKGLTKENHPSLRAASEKLMGKIPDYSKYRKWYEGPHECIHMRSSYEVAFAHWCDAGRYRWKYEPHMFYVGKGSWRGTHYIPDFLLIDVGVYVETKGRMSPENAAKLAEFRRRYPDIPLSVVGRDDLRAAGVIGKAA